MNVYPFIEAEKVGEHNVTRACALLEVSRSAFYAQRGDAPCARERADCWSRPSKPQGTLTRDDPRLRSGAGARPDGTIWSAGTRRPEWMASCTMIPVTRHQVGVVLLQRNPAG